MKRRIPGLHINREQCEQLEGIFLVRVENVFYRWHRRKPFLDFRFVVLEPAEHHGHCLTGRLYCTPKAAWKLNWFLRDFGYPADLLERDEIEEKCLLGLCGVVRIARAVLNGHSFSNLDAFAPAHEWHAVATEQANTNGL